MTSQEMSYFDIISCHLYDGTVFQSTLNWSWRSDVTVINIITDIIVIIVIITSIVIVIIISATVIVCAHYYHALCDTPSVLLYIVLYLQEAIISG